MRTKYNRLLQIFLFVIAVAMGHFSDANAQIDTINRSYGFAASIQGGQAQFMVPFWIGPKMVVVPGVGVSYIEAVATNVNGVVTVRFYRKIARVSPYWGILGIVNVLMPKGIGSTKDFGAGALAGAEFFLNNQFSIAIENQARIALTGVMTLNTAVAVIANIYF